MVKVTAKVNNQYLGYTLVRTENESINDSSTYILLQPLGANIRILNKVKLKTGNKHLKIGATVHLSFIKSLNLRYKLLVLLKEAPLI